jgi:hypothetical protein
MGETEQQEVKQEQKPQVIEVVEGSLVAKDHRELGAILTQVASGGGFPQRFDTKEKRLAAYGLGHSLMGDQWQLALNNIAIIKGQMCIYGELPGTLAERTGEVQEKEVYCIDANYNKICTANKNLDAEIYGAVCVIQRKGRVKKEFTYTLDEAIKAGQYPPTKYDKETRKQVHNPDSPWEKFLKVMLMRKAMSMAVKFEFPEALVGVPVAEYDFDQAPDLIKDVTPNQVDKAQLLNDKFKSQDAHLDNGAEAVQ